MSYRMRIYEFIAAPAHAWLWLCGRLVGWSFEFGPTDEKGDFIKPAEPPNEE